ncbi:MAG: hypothetical protein KDC98_17600, partial [Planctomycetes bacterium]|nr:hypothetical protein [Planctomycetota bacterium]
MDVDDRRGDPARMRHAGSFRILLLLLAASLAARTAAAQTAIALPDATGNLTAPDGWTVLSAGDLDAMTRASDPQDGPALAALLAVIGDIKAAGRTQANLVMHRPGSAAGQIRILDAYSAPTPVTAAELHTAASIEQIRNTFEEHLSRTATKVVFHGESRPELFAVGSLALTFRLDLPSATLHKQLIVVPAGDRLQYFEATFAPDDLDAATAIAGVLRTFDGAREPVDDDIVRKMLLG